MTAASVSLQCVISLCRNAWRYGSVCSAAAFLFTFFVSTLCVVKYLTQYPIISPDCFRLLSVLMTQHGNFPFKTKMFAEVRIFGTLLHDVSSLRGLC